MIYVTHNLTAFNYQLWYLGILQKKVAAKLGNVSSDDQFVLKWPKYAQTSDGLSLKFGRNLLKVRPLGTILALKWSVSGQREIVIIIIIIIGRTDLKVNDEDTNVYLVKHQRLKVI